MEIQAGVETTFGVRYAETDAMGIVHHSVYLVWYEEGRSAWFRERIGDPRGYALFEVEGLAFAVTEARARYVAPARYGDYVTVRAWPTAIRSRGFTMTYEVRQAATGALLNEGYTTHLCLNREGAVVAVPAMWAARLWPEIAAPEVARC